MNKQQKATLRIKALDRFKFDVYLAQQRYELENNKVDMDHLVLGMKALEDRMESLSKANKEFQKTLKKLS